MTIQQNGLENLNDECLNKFLALIHSLTGITINPSRKFMVQGRIRKRAMALSINSYEAYFDFLKENESERPLFIDSVTTNETYFFRTPRIWDYLSEKFLPQWLQENPGGQFNAWSAAASTGDEANTLGIVCQEFKEKCPSFRYQILGTDISQEMIKFCQSGLYKGRSIESFKNLKPQLFAKYMKQVNSEQFQNHADIRARINFKEHNLFKLLNSKDNFDLILIRNVLIYFTPSDQEKVIALATQKLRPTGILIIGESETLTNIKTNLVSIAPFIYKKASHTQTIKPSAVA